MTARRAPGNFRIRRDLRRLGLGILQISAHVIGDSGDAEIQWQIEVAS